MTCQLGKPFYLLEILLAGFLSVLTNRDVCVSLTLVIRADCGMDRSRRHAFRYIPSEARVRYPTFPDHRACTVHEACTEAWVCGETRATYREPRSRN